MKVAKDYNITVRPSNNVWAAILKDMKTELKVRLCCYYWLIVIFCFNSCDWSVDWMVSKQWWTGGPVVIGTILLCTRVKICCGRNLCSDCSHEICLSVLWSRGSLGFHTLAYVLQNFCRKICKNLQWDLWWRRIIWGHKTLFFCSISINACTFYFNSTFSFIGGLEVWFSCAWQRFLVCNLCSYHFSYLFNYGLKKHW